MSLIPSESYSFPDHFSRTISRARVLKEIKSTRAVVKPQPRRQRVVETTPPAPAPAQLLPVTPRTGTSRQVLTNGVGRPANRKPYGPVRVTPRAHVDPAREKPVAAEAEQMSFEIDNGDVERGPANIDIAVKVRRRSRLIRFILAELVVLAVLIPSAVTALSHRFTDPALILTMNLLTIVSAIVAGIIPIVFFAIAPTLPRNFR